MSEVYAKIYYKKNKPYPETLEKHTLNLLNELERLKRLYKEEFKKLGINEDFWNALKLACLFHDLGKISSHFQAKIKKILGETYKVPSELNKEIPHNYLSGIFLYVPEVKKSINKNFFQYILYSVLFHHHRNLDFTKEYYQKVIEDDLSKNIEAIKWLEEFGIDIKELPIKKSQVVYKKIEKFYYNQNDISELKKDKTFILLKGLLHRIDHSASAHLPVEQERIENPEEKLLEYLSEKTNFKGLKPFQQKASEIKDKNVLLNYYNLNNFRFIFKKSSIKLFAG